MTDSLLVGIPGSPYDETPVTVRADATASADTSAH
jgi:hypothetical protein